MNKTISDLNLLEIVSDNDVLLVETPTETMKTTKSNLLKEVNKELNNHTHTMNDISDLITSNNYVVDSTSSIKILSSNLTSDVPVYENGYRVIFYDDFDGKYLNKFNFTSDTIKSWTAEQSKEQKTHYEMTGESILLYTDETMKPWCPEYDGSLKVSTLMSANRTGLHKFSAVGDGSPITNVKKEVTNLTKYGKFELRAKFNLFDGASSVNGRKNHVAWWMIGFQDRDDERCELDIFEIYGDGEYQITFHNWAKDSSLTYRNLPLSVLNPDLANTVMDGEYHTYTMEWDETSGFNFYIDNVKAGNINQFPSYPLMTILNVYEKRESNETIERQNFEIDYFKISKKIPENGSEVSNLLVLNQDIHTISIVASEDNYNEYDGIKNIDSYVDVTWNDGIITQQPVVWDEPTKEQLAILKNGGSFILYGDIKQIPYSSYNKRAKINIEVTSI